MKINLKKVKNLFARKKAVVPAEKNFLKKDEKPIITPPEKPEKPVQAQEPFLQPPISRPKIYREIPPLEKKELKLIKKEEEGIATIEISMKENFGERVAGEGSIDMYRKLKPVMAGILPGEILILDFAKITFIDSSGLGFLVAVNSTLLKQGGKFILKNPPDGLKDLLRITNLYKVIRITFDA